MKRALISSIILFLVSCSSQKYIANAINEHESRFSHHSGFILYDVEQNKTVFNHNSNKYFTPASNTKILTFYTASCLLDDSIPGLYYVQRNDSTIIWGSGDPSLFNEHLPSSKITSFLSSLDTIYFSGANYHDKHFGPGWAWDDYYYDFSAEKSALPMYGNILSVRKETNFDSLIFIPNYFKESVEFENPSYKGDLERSIGNNEFVLSPSSKEQYNLAAPFIANNNTLVALLNDTLNTIVKSVNLSLPDEYNVMHSVPTDSALKRMMLYSDNFIAEQLLLVCSSIVSDSLNSETAINWAQDSLLEQSPDPFIWIDGSGLSRYNLMTPRSAVWLWKKLLSLYGEDKLFSLIGRGGEPGQLETYYQAEQPYIFAKTGTLSNNYSLSGFLKTKSGKLLIFSFMNSNFPKKAAPVKRNVESILNEIYNNY